MCVISDGAVTFCDDELSARVELGAAWMDRNEADWWHAVDVPRLNMGSPWDCIFGQVFGGYRRKANALGWTAGELQELGFTLCGETPKGTRINYRENYKGLTRLWGEQINQRLAA